MVRIVDVDDQETTVGRILDAMGEADSVFIRRDGKVVARIDPADELDVEDAPAAT